MRRKLFEASLCQIEISLPRNSQGENEMTDYRKSSKFKKAYGRARQIILKAVVDNVPDAKFLVLREAAWNNLQAHAHSVIPLAVLFAVENRGLLRGIRANTDLWANMGGHSVEARSNLLWKPIKMAMCDFVRRHSHDIVAEEKRSGQPQTCRKIATTYLSDQYGGRHGGGGRGNTVVKRTLKLLAHLRF